MQQLRFLLPALFIAAPASSEPSTEIAVRVGPSAATFNQRFRENRYGLSGGIGGYREHSLSGRFSLGAQVDLGYTARGTEVVFDGQAPTQSRLHYFDMLLAVRPTVKLGPSRTYLLLGAGLNLLGSARDDEPSGRSEDVTDELNRVDVALLAGAGVALRLPPRSLGPLSLGSVFIEARHDRGLLDIDKHDFGFKNRTTSVMLGMSFALASGAVSQPAPSSRSALSYAGAR